MSGTVSSVFYFMFTILIGFFAIPLAMYSIVQFYQFKDDRRFRKRHGRLSTFTALCFVAELFSGCLLTLAFSGFMPIKITIGLAWIGDILNFTSYFLIIHCLVLRFWSLYYDIRYQLSTNDNSWKSLIDEHFVINEEHLSQVKSFDIEDDLWFIKNKKTKGSSRWMIRTWFIRSFLTILVLLFVMVIIEMIFSVGLRRGVIEVIFTLLFFIPWFFMIFIYHKIPQFHDTYFIRREIVVIHNIDLVDVLASAIVSIVANYGIYTASNSSSNPYKIILENPYLNILMIVTFYVMGISHMIIIYIMTYWVRNKIIEDELHITRLKDVTSAHDHYLSLGEILQHQSGYGYELFMQHLKYEFSIENLLSLTEFMQWKCMIKKTHNIEQALQIELAMDHIPRSTIVYEHTHRSGHGNEAANVAMNGKGMMNRMSRLHSSEVQEEQHQHVVGDQDQDEEYRKIIYKLYRKYIRIGGDLEVNISWQARNTFIGYIDESKKTVHSNISLQFNEYFAIFDDCIAEVLRLMKNDSYARFTHTQAYQQLVHAIEDNNTL